MENVWNPNIDNGFPRVDASCILEGASLDTEVHEVGHNGHSANEQRYSRYRRVTASLGRRSKNVDVLLSKVQSPAHDSECVQISDDLWDCPRDFGHNR